jgi:hypothetical protein
MGRSIVRNPKVFLMDEPLSNLDAKLRGATRREILLLHKRLKATMLYVTHDQTEALTLADRIVCMSMGHVQQVGTPLELYDTPNNVFVASFIGLPPMNLFDVVFEDGGLKGKGFEAALTDSKRIFWQATPENRHPGRRVPRTVAGRGHPAQSDHQRKPWHEHPGAGVHGRGQPHHRQAAGLDQLQKRRRSLRPVRQNAFLR